MLSLKIVSWAGYSLLGLFPLISLMLVIEDTSLRAWALPFLLMGCFCGLIAVFFGALDRIVTLLEIGTQKAPREDGPNSPSKVTKGDPGWSRLTKATD